MPYSITSPSPSISSTPTRGLHVSSPNGVQILRWLSEIAGYRIFNLRPHKSGQISGDTPLSLIRMQEADLENVYMAAQFANGLALFRPMEETVRLLEEDLGSPLEAAIPLDTGLKSVGRKAVLLRQRRNIVLAFEATKPNEMKMNAWSHAHDGGWTIPYARFLDGRQVHSFYLDMWLGMREAALEGLSRCIDEMADEGMEPERLLITGHSMGGGISVLALMDIVEHIRHQYGSASSSPFPWASDSSLARLIQHITFAEFAAASPSYHQHLNAFYSHYQIPAWDIVHPQDFTSRLHMPFFRGWRGYRYELPKEATRGLEKEFAAGRHDMPGYLAACKRLKDKKRVLRSQYMYPKIAKS